MANMAFNAIRENKILAKISEFTVNYQVIPQHLVPTDFALMHFHINKDLFIVCVDIKIR